MDAQESQIYSAFVIAILVIGSIIGYFIFSAIKQQKRVLALQIQNARAEITALEKDRARIAADLHDELSPMLVAVKMKINSFELSDPFDQEQLDKTNQTIDDMAARMRAISFDLMPTALQTKGLVVALREFINYISPVEGLKIHFLPPNDPIPLSEQYAINLYRIIQEIIHNTIKHADATELTIGLKRNSNTLVLQTVDNGTGFDHDKALNDDNGLGLRSLANRVNLLSAELSVNAKPGKGSSYTIEIPLKNG